MVSWVTVGLSPRKLKLDSCNGPIWSSDPMENSTRRMLGFARKDCGSGWEQWRKGQVPGRRAGVVDGFSKLPANV